ncbi:beta-L-arabinofuranosidase domain-containing protein [Streptomyces sp. NPDC052727]|uniref:beta-L-arabinofuranosidase domain-containing protein n=1 Tax=Streptomyces sp. NPDC052727 TaxID=3154854 RepID=UPI003413342F
MPSPESSATRGHSYVIGGDSNGETFHEPDAVAGQLSNKSCENRDSYNMLKLARLPHSGPCTWWR